MPIYCPKGTLSYSVRVKLVYTEQLGDGWERGGKRLSEWLPRPPSREFIGADRFWVLPSWALVRKPWLFPLVLVYI